MQHLFRLVPTWLREPTREIVMTLAAIKDSAADGRLVFTDVK
jgi:hypothetical protein